MRLRTLTGQRWPAKCADGCGAEIPAGPEVKVVVDLEARPRKAWIPEHSPDAGTWGGSRTAVRPSPSNGTNGGTGRPAPSPTRTSPPPRPPAPTPTSSRPCVAPSPPPSPVASSSGGEEEEPHETEGVAPTPHQGRTWVSGSLSLASCRSALATHAREGESDEDLLARVNLLLAQDLDTKVRAVKALRESLGIPERGRARAATEGA
ncbi:MAG: hypothetical protein KGJ23_11225 [Euryarchaeota archaeon]|nr:hypothetical protein [Euryarchaeota archaeon]MDE1837165.1 hypothetical protein [Euryarchaeota archaeon]MDE1881497.1 hypothetical protein [Euryarchaeota archaeon]MDE2045321.1 hypothetical protein [Thermoplasmata archaeon]